MDALQRAIPGPQVEIGPHCALRRQVFGQRLPLAACPQHVENSVQNLAHVDRALAAALLSRWHHGLDNRPFGASQITRITKTDAVRSNAMFRLPHRALPPRESNAQHRITTDSSDSTTSWIGSKSWPKALCPKSAGRESDAGWRTGLRNVSFRRNQTDPLPARN